MKQIKTQKAATLLLGLLWVFIAAGSDSSLADQKSESFKLIGKTFFKHDGLDGLKLRSDDVLLYSVPSEDMSKPQMNLYQTYIEIYRAKTHRFEPLASPSIFRGTPTLIELQDGQILFTDIYCKSVSKKNEVELDRSLCEASKYIEIYNPDSNTYHTGPKMLNPRQEHTMVLLENGQVLFVGGYGPKMGSEEAKNSFPIQAEIFDPVANQFILVDEYNHGHDTAVGLDDNKVLMLDTHHGTAKIFEPRTGSSYPVGNMIEKRSYPITLKLLDGRILILSDNNTSAEIFDPKSETFRSVGNMKAERGVGFKAAVLKNGTVLISGGSYDKLIMRNKMEVVAFHKSAEIFDPVTETFHLVNNMKKGRIHHKIFPLKDGTALIAGGGLWPDYQRFTELFLLGN